MWCSGVFAIVVSLWRGSRVSQRRAARPLLHSGYHVRACGRRKGLIWVVEEKLAIAVFISEEAGEGRPRAVLPIQLIDNGLDELAQRVELLHLYDLAAIPQARFYAPIVVGGEVIVVVGVVAVGVW